jgi:hypothetical protein
MTPEMEKANDDDESLFLAEVDGVDYYANKQEVDLFLTISQAQHLMATQYATGVLSRDAACTQLQSVLSILCAAHGSPAVLSLLPLMPVSSSASSSSATHPSPTPSPSDDSVFLLEA